MQSRQMPSPLLPVITPPQHPSAAPGAALETTPAPKALSVSMGFGNLWGPCPWRSKHTNTSCTNAQCHPDPRRVSDRFPSCHSFAFLDAVHLQHSHHPQPFHLDRQFQMCGRRHRKCIEKLGIPPAGMGSAPHQVRQSSPNCCCHPLPFSLQPHH